MCHTTVTNEIRRTSTGDSMKSIRHQSVCEGVSFTSVTRVYVDRFSLFCHHIHYYHILSINHYFVTLTKKVNVVIMITVVLKFFRDTLHGPSWTILYVSCSLIRHENPPPISPHLSLFNEIWSVCVTPLWSHRWQARGQKEAWCSGFGKYPPPIQRHTHTHTYR